MDTNRRIPSRQEVEQRKEPELSDGEMIPGMLSHKSEERTQGGSRTGGPVRPVDPV